MNTEPDNSATDDDSCDHDWRYQCDDFDHEFGTERVRYWMCELCGDTCGEHEHEPDVDPPEPDDYPYYD